MSAWGPISAYSQCDGYVRFNPESRLQARASDWPESAKRGLMHRSKIGISFDHLVGARKQ